MSCNCCCSALLRLGADRSAVLLPSSAFQRAQQTMQAWPRQGLIGLVHGYRLLLKPWLGSVCRFEPTCSAYALGALQQHGAAAGGYLAVRRILRCQPWCDGGCDPVPATAPPLFTRLLSSKPGFATLLDPREGRSGPKPSAGAHSSKTRP